MKFEPHGIILSCDMAAGFPHTSVFEAIPDCGLEIYVPSGIGEIYRNYERNKISCCLDIFSNIPSWALLNEEVTLIFQFSLKEYAIEEISRYFKKKYLNLRSRMHIQIADCSAHEFVNIPGIDDLFVLFSDVMLLNENAEAQLLEDVVSPVHRTRRRPCRYPFEYISMDFSGNVFQCPYCDAVITRFRDYPSILKDVDVLYFLASQLLLEIDSYPQCSRCPYWIDGWLGDEKETCVSAAHQDYSLLWNGHVCQILQGDSR